MIESGGTNRWDNPAARAEDQNVDLPPTAKRFSPRPLIRPSPLPQPIGLQFPAHVELKVTATESGVRGDTASGSVTKAATLETGMEIRVPLFIKEGEKIKVHTETREFAGRA